MGEAAEGRLPLWFVGLDGALVETLPHDVDLVRIIPAGDTKFSSWAIVCCVGTRTARARELCVL